MHNVETLPGKLGSPRAASTADGGTALTTTATLISIPLGADWISLTPRNFTTAVVVKFALNPYLAIIKTTDALVATSGYDDFSVEAQDGDSIAMSFASMDTAANGDYLYVGADRPFRGVAVDMAAAVNSTASVLTVNYWNGSWSSISAVDGTAAGGATLAQDGNVTWTVPATWAKKSLNAIGDTILKTSWSMPELYWTRWQVSVQLDTSVDIAQLRALNESTAYAELLSGQTYETALKSEGPGDFACVEALTNAGTANLIVNAATKRSERWE